MIRKPQHTSIAILFQKAILKLGQWCNDGQGCEFGDPGSVLSIKTIPANVDLRQAN